MSEICYRFNWRFCENQTFHRFLNACASMDKITFSELIGEIGPESSQYAPFFFEKRLIISFHKCEQTTISWFSLKQMKVICFIIEQIRNDLKRRTWFAIEN